MSNYELTARTPADSVKKVLDLLFGNKNVVGLTRNLIVPRQLNHRDADATNDFLQKLLTDLLPLKWLEFQANLLDETSQANAEIAVFAASSILGLVVMNESSVFGPRNSTILAALELEFARDKLKKSVDTNVFSESYNDAMELKGVNMVNPTYELLTAVAVRATQLQCQFVFQSSRQSFGTGLQQ